MNTQKFPEAGTGDSASAGDLLDRWRTTLARLIALGGRKSPWLQERVMIPQKFTDHSVNFLGPRALVRRSGKVSLFVEEHIFWHVPRGPPFVACDLIGTNSVSSQHGLVPTRWCMARRCHCQHRHPAEVHALVRATATHFHLCIGEARTRKRVRR